MYKIIGADGKEYGPISVDQLKEWVAQGRINAATRLQSAGSAEWKAAGDFPELARVFAVPGTRQPSQGAPPILSAPKPKVQDKGLAVLSFVLGISSFVLCVNV